MNINPQFGSVYMVKLNRTRGDMVTTQKWNDFSKASVEIMDLKGVSTSSGNFTYHLQLGDQDKAVSVNSSKEISETHFEATGGHAFSPKSPKQRILSRLFDVIGSDGLLRPALHYRWSFPEENSEFLRFHFESIMSTGPDRSEFQSWARPPQPVRRRLAMQLVWRLKRWT